MSECPQPVCELLIPVEKRIITERCRGLDPDALHPTSTGSSTLIEIACLLAYSNSILHELFPILPEVGLVMRSVEAGGFDEETNSGRACILTNSRGKALGGTSPTKNILPFRPSLWRRTFKGTIYEVHAITKTAEYIESHQYLRESIGNNPIGETKGEYITVIRAVHRRTLPIDGLKLTLSHDPAEAKAQIAVATEETKGETLEDWDQDTLAEAVKASFVKSQCPGCSHIHYGKSRVRKRGYPQPEHNLTNPECWA